MKQKCQQTVFTNRGLLSSRCSKNATVQRDGKFYCKIHDPEYIKDKHRKQDKEYELSRCKNEECSYYFGKSWYLFCPICGFKKE